MRRDTHRNTPTFNFMFTHFTFHQLLTGMPPKCSYIIYSPQYNKKGHQTDGQKDRLSCRNNSDFVCSSSCDFDKRLTSLFPLHPEGWTTFTLGSVPPQTAGTAARFCLESLWIKAPCCYQGTQVWDLVGLFSWSRNTDLWTWSTFLLWESSRSFGP